jgi:hypothetical protein
MKALLNRSHKTYKNLKRPHPLTFRFLSFPISLNLQQQLIDALTFLFDPVADEVNLRCAREIQRESELFSHVRRGVLQSCECFLVLFLVTCHRDVNARGTLVSRQTNVGDRDHCQSWVFQLVADNLSDLLSESVRCSFLTPHCSLTSLQLSRRDPLDDVSLNLISNLDVVEVFQTDTTLKAFADFRDVVLKPAQR